ncbi:MAG: YciI family protein, partial [Limisphaerales bacterium]
YEAGHAVMAILMGREVQSVSLKDRQIVLNSEQLGGYFLIDAKDLDEAIGIAARIPMVHKGTVEIRPVVEISGLPAD